MPTTRFAVRVKELRAQRRMSQAELAATVGVSRESIARLMTGASDPPLGTVERLAKALGVTVELRGRCHIRHVQLDRLFRLPPSHKELVAKRYRTPFRS